MAETREEKYARISSSPYFGTMNQDRRECVAFLRSDLYRLDEGDPPYDCVDTWRYAAPGGAFKVTLTYGERHLLGHVVNADGSLLAATSHATVEWLDEVLP